MSSQSHVMRATILIAPCVSPAPQPGAFTKARLNSPCLFAATDVHLSPSLSPPSPNPQRAQLNHFHWTLRPVVHPAHNQIAPAEQVAVTQEIPALFFKLNLYQLPALVVDLTHRLAIGKLLPDSHHHKTQVPGHHAEQVHHSHLVSRAKSHAPVHHRWTINWTVSQNLARSRRPTGRKSGRVRQPCPLAGRLRYVQHVRRSEEHT